MAAIQKTDKKTAILLVILIVLSMALILYAGVISKFYSLPTFSFKVILTYFGMTVNALFTIFLIFRYGFKNKQVFTIIEYFHFTIQLFLVSILSLIGIKYESGTVFLVLSAVLFGFISAIYAILFLWEVKNYMMTVCYKK